MCYNSARVRDISEIFVFSGVVPSNAANQVLLRPTLVAMAMKFGTKWAITRVVQ